MKRSTLIAIIVIFISVITGGVLGFYFYLNSKNVEVSNLGRKAVEQQEVGSFGNPGVNTSIILPGNASSTLEEQTPEVTATTTPPAPNIPIFRHIYEEPIAGASFFIKDIFATSSAITETVYTANGTSTKATIKVIKPAETRKIGQLETVNFIDRATGHIYETATSTLDLTKTSNTTIPKIYEAMFLTKESLILRGLYEGSDIVKTMYGIQKTISPTSTEKVLTTKELPADLRELVLSPNKTKVLFTQNKGATLSIANIDGTSQITAFDSPFKEWLIQWPKDSFISLTTKPTAFAPGYMYSLNPTTRNLKKVLGGISGLTTLMSPDANKVLYSQSENGSPNLKVFDISKNQTLNLYFRTFPEKCVWSKKTIDIVYCAVPQDIAFGDYPDAWYQGLIFFTDDIWKINTKTGESRLVAKLNSLSDEPIDTINPVLNPSESYMLLSNKIDLSLWGLKLILDEQTATSTATTTSSKK